MTARPTADAMVGGKFANGALSGAVQAAMARVSNLESRGRAGGNGQQIQDYQVAELAVAEAEEGLVGVRQRRYVDKNELAKDVADVLLW